MGNSRSAAGRISIGQACRTILLLFAKRDTVATGFASVLMLAKAASVSKASVAALTDTGLDFKMYGGMSAQTAGVNESPLTHLAHKIAHTRVDLEKYNKTLTENFAKNEYSELVKHCNELNFFCLLFTHKCNLNNKNLNL